MAATDVVMDRRPGMLLVLCFAAGHCANAVEPMTPEQVIATTADAFAALVETRHAELEADLKMDYAMVDEYLLPRFDFASASHLMLREHWKRATPEQRQRFADAFYRHLVASYGKALLEFRHDTITLLPARDDATGTSAHVRTKVRLTDGSAFDVDFYMRLDDRGWRVVDVIAEGVSYVRTYRSEFGIEIRASSLEALTARLEESAGRER